MEYRNPDILIVGHARHGKGTVSEMFRKYGLISTSSSVAAAELFIYDALKEKYGYKSYIDCFEDRVNHRKEWFDLIVEYNKDDPARLARDIMRTNDIYDGMRSNKEINKCIEEGIFDMIIWVEDPRKPKESKESFDIDRSKLGEYYFLLNDGTLHDLEQKVDRLAQLLCLKHSLELISME